ncbi:TonB-dependent receptor [Robertkochia solimangrovi]|uniref:TonB-dependent receptor n=1 Tax=Robertkochia solimangrovi TaxID=2213046 RepID=UPI00117C5151|nr:TonB-dependent receptor [Robertkochia solimangrovi]TRZ41943.1 TonB-dependent siderophore receptor [Robertkochia solimangrovi]
MQKLLPLTLLVFLISFTAFAQSASVSGKILSSDKSPLRYATVSIENNSRGAITDEKGAFTISNLAAGTYTLVISHVGHTTSKMDFNLANGQALTLADIILNSTEEELDAVVVESNKTNKFYKKESVTVSKMPLKDIENPQVYNAISGDLLRDQVVTNFNDALKNATGISRLWESTGRGGDGAAYYSLRGFSVQQTMTNGLPAKNNGGLDPANVESIEVIKGPSGTLFGSSLISYGGLINVVTKKPYNYFGGEIGYTGGSYGLNRFTADINTPLDKDNQILLRTNAAYTVKNSFQDAGEQTSVFVAPSLTYNVNEKLTFILNTEILNRESVNAPMIFLNRNVPLLYESIDIFEQNYKNSFTSNNLSIKNPTFSFQGQMLYKLNDAWTSQTVLSRSTAKSDGYYSYLWDLGDGDSFARYIQRANQETRTTDIQQNFIGDFKIAGMRNRVVVGLDYFHTNLLNNSSGWAGHGVVTLSDGADTGVLSQNAVDTSLENSGVTNAQTEQEIYSAYVSNVTNILPELSVMLSLRVDQFEGDKANDDDDQTALSPKFGIVYQPIKDKLSVFGNYMNGFSNIAAQPYYDNDGNNLGNRSFDPEQANQWEVGVKTDLLENKLSATASYYDITVSNILMTDPNNPQNSYQGGEIASKGFELSVIANPLEGWNIVAGFSNNDSEVVKDEPDAGYIGMRPESAGPETLVNFWTSYTLTEGPLAGWGVGFGGNYASKFATLNRSNIGSFYLPSYTVLNGSVSYNAKKYSVILKLDNITNEKYFTGWSTVSPQQARSISAGLSYRF